MQKLSLQNFILIITPGFPKDEQDDTCIPYLQDFVLFLAETIGKENVKVIALQYPFTHSTYRWNDIEVYSAGGENKKGINRFFTWRNAQKKAANWIVPEKTIIHAFWLTEATYIGVKLAKKYNCKIFATIMGQDVLPSNKYLAKLELRKIVIITPNEKTAETLYLTTHKKADAIITPAVKPIPIINAVREIDLLFVGSMIQLKRPALFIDIVVELSKIYKNLNCVMIGDGIMLESIKNEIQNRQLSQITLTGKINRAYVLQYMSRSKFLVHTSAYEGHATVFSEAIATGMHAVCFDVGRPQHQHIYSCDNTNEMIEKLNNLLLSPPDFISDQSYTMQNVVHQYQEMYTK